MCIQRQQERRKKGDTPHRTRVAVQGVQMSMERRREARERNRTDAVTARDACSHTRKHKNTGIQAGKQPGRHAYKQKQPGRQTAKPHLRHGHEPNEGLRLCATSAAIMGATGPRSPCEAPPHKPQEATPAAARQHIGCGHECRTPPLPRPPPPRTAQATHERRSPSRSPNPQALPFSPRLQCRACARHCSTGEADLPESGRRGKNPRSF